MDNVLYVSNKEDTSFKIKSEQYNFITTVNTSNLIDNIIEKSIDLIILDLNNNFNIARQLKLNDKTKKIPIIFLITAKDEKTIDNVFKYGVDFLVKPYEDFELVLRINAQIEIVQLHKKYEKEIIFNQSVLDSQQNIIFVHDDEGLINVNKSFYSFFNVKSIKAFEDAYHSVANLFMEYENYFSLHVLNNNKPWLNHISDRANVQYDVILMNFNTFEPETFIIDVNPIPYSDKFVVTLTNITILTTKSKQLEIKANYDSLTKIYNRNKFNEFIQLHYDLFTRSYEDICLAIFDIDFFKQVNDEYGHLIGDEILISFSNIINDSIRKTDIFARWGGEEFTLLMPKTKINDAFFVVDNLRKSVEEYNFKVVGNKTCSIGITQFKDGDTIEEILIRADEALYESKETGRNKVCKR